MSGFDPRDLRLLGLALAVGVLVDDATVEIENVHRQMATGKPLIQAILDGAQEIGFRAENDRRGQRLDLEDLRGPRILLEVEVHRNERRVDVPGDHRVAEDFLVELLGIWLIMIFLNFAFALHRREQSLDRLIARFDRFFIDLDAVVGIVDPNSTWWP